MRIQHNIAAINNYRSQQQLGKVVSGSMEKLSSGKRINRAADDAAGLAISEKMRAQVRGLEQAKKNIKDGISLIQTTESAIGQLQNPILARMRELVIQGASDTLTEAERLIINNELKQLAASIDDIAIQTQFNTQQVLGPKEILDDGNEQLKIDIVFLIDDSSSMQEEIDMVRSGIKAFTQNISQYGDVKLGTMSLVQNRDVKLPITDNIDEIVNHIEKNHKAVGGLVAPIDKIDSILNTSNSLGLRQGSEKVFILLTDTYIETGTQIISEELKQKMIDEKVQSYLFGINMTNGTNNFSHSSAYDFVTEKFIPNTAEEIAENISPGIANDIIVNAGKGQLLEPSELYLQVGANSLQSVSIDFMDFRSATLHVGALSVDSYEEAMGALRRIDTANNDLSKARSYYGAMQNRLEYTYENVSIASENLLQSLSKIEDTNYPDLIANLQAEQVILQAAQSMGAQANQQLQGILQLLQ